jgi:hypothetical protein
MERVFNVERDGMLVPTPKPTLGPHDFNARLARFGTKLLEGWSIPPRLSVNETVELWSGRKKIIYQKAALSLLQSSVEERDAKLSTFVKAEKINITAKRDPAPRVIQPRDPRYNLELARYLKHTEHKLFNKIDRLFDWNKIGDRTIFKGMDAWKSGEYFHKKASQYSSPVFIGLDASRFDQHVSDLALGFEHKMWRKLCGGDKKDLKKLLNWQMYNKGIARIPDGFIKYSTTGCRMSGDINTSSGNCLIMCALVYSYMHSLGIKKFSLANNGDDCVLMLQRGKESKILATLPTWFEEMGFTMKVEKPVYHIQQAEFCQTRCLRINKSWRMVRNLKAACSKDTYAVSGLTHDNRVKAWVTSVGEAGRIQNQGVPVLQDFYSAYPDYQCELDVELQEELNRKRIYSLGHHGDRVIEDTTITDESRYQCWLAFGITPEEQQEVEAQLRQWVFGVGLGSEYGIPAYLLDVCSTS